MLKTATLTIVIGAVSALFALNADALPLASAKQQARYREYFDVGARR